MRVLSPSDIWNYVLSLVFEPSIPGETLEDLTGNGELRPACNHSHRSVSVGHTFLKNSQTNLIFETHNYYPSVM
jgi:hypothetical protein